MRLLFDQNLAPRLIAELEDLYPDSLHVRQLQMAHASDATIWQYALEHALAIVSKDSDFHQRSFLSAPAPKVIWIRLGNCTTTQIAALLRDNAADVHAFLRDPLGSFLALG